MKKIQLKYILSLLITLVTLSASAQVTSLYYMKNIAQRHDLNPAFQPESKVYIDLPLIPTFQLELGNNSLVLSDAVYPQLVNGKMKTITFLDLNAEDLSKNIFLDKLKDNTKLYTDVRIDLLSFGWRKNRSYYTFGIAERVEASVVLPKDLFKLALFGTPDTVNVNSFNLNSLSVQSTVYTEYALGYSEQFSDKLNLGMKAKLLLGQANMSTKMSKFTIDASREEWDLNIDGEINASVPFVTYELNEDGEIEDLGFKEPEKTKDYADVFLKPSGVGMSLDFGADYKITNQLSVSASILDLGFINWKNNTVNLPSKASYAFDGLHLDISDSLNIEKFLQEIEDSLSYNTTFNNYRSSIYPKLLAGISYSFLDEKIILGVVSKSVFANKSVFQEFTTSANFAPTSYLNAAFSYSIMNGRFSNLGAGLGLRAGMFNLYVVGDYFPVKFTTQYIPHKTGMVDLRVGMYWSFGNKKKVRDEDGDGVPDKLDLCPGTPKGVPVDENGCPFDEDGDGVPDYLDDCPDTPAGYQVDERGCTVDSDKDGVPNNLDLCPGTPNGVPVDENGCPFDEDGDGIPDYLDKCPNTPEGVEVDKHGCPIDSDGDGVPDYLDECPGTPKEAHGFVDSKGCPIDTDGDGVPDYLDECPGTPKEAHGFVDNKGCPIDTDGDGIPDYLDNCPTIKGVKENHGCPEIKKEEKQVFEKALQGIQFETGKDVIKSESYAVLNQIVDIMNKNKDYFLDIYGHTDNVGDPVKNQKLSEDRAASVERYLMSKGVSAERIETKGFGDTKPIADNSTAAGKKKNRRVEFVVRFER